jgi:hypothetical protein
VYVRWCQLDGFNPPPEDIAAMYAVKTSAERYFWESLDEAAQIAHAAQHPQAASDVRPREGERGFFDVTCGACGGEHGTNFAIDQIECPHCESRRCPHCGGWFGEELP